MFHVYERDETGEETLLYVAEMGVQASVFVSHLKTLDPTRKPFIRRIKTEINDDAWIAREQARFAAGTYTPLPWINEPWHKPLLFGHPSIDKPAMLSYTPSADYGRADRQLRVRPGRFLEKIECPDVQHWCSVYSAAFEENELKFAETADDIEAVYTNGPSSCMSHPARTYDGHIHPVRVYAAGDITLAYIGSPEPGEVTARALVWRKKMVHNTIYGDAGRLLPLLAKAGFSPGNFSGARLLKIENMNGDGWIMPYLDGDSGLNYCGDHFEIMWGGDYWADTTNGLIEDHCDRCCSCERDVDADDATCDDDGDYWCDQCWNEQHFYCEKCGESYHHSVPHDDVDGDTWCENCLDRYAVCCYTCDKYVFNRNAETIASEYYCPDCVDDARNDEIEESARHIRARACSSAIDDPRPWELNLKFRAQELHPLNREYA